MGHEIKNLDLFVGGSTRRKLSNCIVLDSSVNAFQKHVTNGIIVPKFMGNKDDQTLKGLQNYLIKQFGV